MESILQEITSWKEFDWEFLTNVFIKSKKISNQDKRALFDVIRDKALELSYKKGKKTEEKNDSDFYNAILDNLRYSDFNINLFLEILFMFNYSYIGSEADFYYERVLTIAAVKLSSLLKITYQFAYDYLLNYWNDLCKSELTNEISLEENNDDLNKISNLIKRLQREKESGQ